MPRPKRSEPTRQYTQKAFNPTEEQSTLFYATKQAAEITAGATATDLSIQVEGVAGCGKTATIIQDITQHIGKRMRVVAFNRSAAQELGGRLMAYGISPDTASTYHVYGKDLIIREVGYKPRINEYKIYDMMDLIGIKERPLRGLYASAVSLAKGELLFDPTYATRDTDIERMRDLLTEHGLDDDFIGVTGSILYDPIDTIHKLIHRSISQTDSIDFDDMVSFPGYYKISPAALYDIFYVDEYQDSNPAQEYIALNSGGKLLVAIGDPNQAIYAFRGAGNDSMDRLMRSCKATGIEFHRLSLSFNWRCDQRIIDLAKQLVPRIQARPGAPDGTIQTDMINPEIVDRCGQTYAASYNDGHDPETSMLVCRRNAPLIKYMFSMIKANIPAYRNVKPNDPVEKMLVKMVAHVAQHSRTKEQAGLVLDTYVYSQIEKLEVDGESARSQRARSKADRLYDLKDCCQTLITLTDTPAQLPETLARLTPKTPPLNSVTLSTVHKAKGTEADNVYVVGTEFLGDGLRRERVTGDDGVERVQVVDHSGEQELNIAYVALTRAKKYLGFEGELPRWLRL